MGSSPKEEWSRHGNGKKAEVRISISENQKALDENIEQIESKEKPTVPYRTQGGYGWAVLGFLALLIIHIYTTTDPRGWDVRRLDPAHIHNSVFYLKCAIAGAFGCASHVVLIPLDVVKVNMQLDPKRYQSLRQSFWLIADEQGWGTAGLLRGSVALIVSFGKQGVVKFGGYEFLKDTFMNYFGYEFSVRHTGFIWLVSACIAEAFADVMLCPCEMLKVKMQTSEPGTFPTDFIPALRRFIAERHENGFPFGSIQAVWSRQIPYTMAKFFCFERLVQFFYMNIFTSPKESYSLSTQLFVTLCSGYLTGIVAAGVSHVPDSLFSLRSKTENANKSYGTLIREYGLFRLATSGLLVRLMIIGCLTAVQWWTYDSLKSLLNLPTTSTLIGKH